VGTGGFYNPSEPSWPGNPKKKEEFSRSMDNLPLENSFPQICVVSVNHFVEKQRDPARVQKDYVLK
jgi:hypothetical protein